MRQQTETSRPWLHCKGLLYIPWSYCLSCFLFPLLHPSSTPSPLPAWLEEDCGFLFLLPYLATGSKWERSQSSVQAVNHERRQKHLPCRLIWFKMRLKFLRREKPPERVREECCTEHDDDVCVSWEESLKTEKEWHKRRGDSINRWVKHFLLLISQRSPFNHATSPGTSCLMDADCVWCWSCHWRRRWRRQKRRQCILDQAVCGWETKKLHASFADLMYALFHVRVLFHLFFTLYCKPCCMTFLSSTAFFHLFSKLFSKPFCSFSHLEVFFPFLTVTYDFTHVSTSACRSILSVFGSQVFLYSLHSSLSSRKS